MFHERWNGVQDNVDPESFFGFLDLEMLLLKNDETLSVAEQQILGGGCQLETTFATSNWPARNLHLDQSVNVITIKKMLDTALSMF
jgi:hypothetical protein